MLKKISNLGKALNRDAQREINGGLGGSCHPERPRNCIDGSKYILQNSGCWIWFCKTTPDSLPME